MATEEEKEKTFAEYFAAGGNGDDDDEPDFDPSDHGEESDPFEDDGDSDDDDEEEESSDEGNDDNYTVLDGRIQLNDEGDRLVYSGTWAMKKDIDAATEDPPKEEEERDDGEGDGSDRSSSSSGGDDKKKKKRHRKKKKKFKFKSKQIVNPPEPSLDKNGDKEKKRPAVFDLTNPTVPLHRIKRDKKDRPQSAAAVPPKRTLLFDGFFLTAEEEGHRKIKERDLEITFIAEKRGGRAPRRRSDSNSSPGRTSSDNGKNSAPIRRFKVLGRGTNEFGEFRIDGTYAVSASNPSDLPPTGVALICNKRYCPTASARCRRRRTRGWSEDQQDLEDDEMSSDDVADYNELIALNEEANMSIEELRRRYYGGGLAESNGGEPPAKKMRTLEDDSDDEGCGF